MKLNILLLANLNILAATLGVMSEPALEAPCADAIGIVANPTEANQLRSLLKKGSLSSLRTEACHHYQAKLTRARGAKGWTVSMTSSGSPRQLERNVTTLAHAAIWIEAWTQSGFAPAPEPVDAEADPSPTTPAAVPVAASTLGAFVGAGPVVMATTGGYGLAGGAMHLGIPARHTPWFGATLGLTTELGPTGVEYRRAFWAGPVVGADVPVGADIHLQPALSTGVFGASAKNTDMTANAVGAYAGLGTNLVWDLSAKVALFAGVEGRFIFTNFLGGSTQLPDRRDDGGGDGGDDSDHDDDDSDSGDDHDQPTVPAPGVGLFVAGLQLGVIWNFGASP